ncbi:MAG: hypothetical protein MR745_05600, partial [Clostridiales bacterium]|nr:hypothetical protein [Clostridiales bacterium]
AAVPALAEGEVAGTPEEPVSDNESVACTHENEPVRYEDNKNGTHKVIYNCGVVKDASVQHTFNDGKCICGAEQPVTEKPTSKEPVTQLLTTSQPEQPKQPGQPEQPATNEPSTQQPTETSEPTCDHSNVTYEQYGTEGESRYTHHKKICSDCKKDWEEAHQWDENTKKPKTEGTGKIPTCTSGGHWTMKCKFCHHVTVFDGPALGHNYEYHWGTWDCKTKTITAYRKCSRPGCDLNEKPTTISVSEKDRDTWYSCGKKYTTVYYKVVANYGNETVEYGGKAECTSSTSDYCRPDWYYDPCYYNNTCGHWGCGDVCTRYSNCVPCQNYRTTFRVGGYNCLATPKTGDVSVIGMALISLAGAGAAIMGKKRK